jgi:hypothetical protein
MVGGVVWGGVRHGRISLPSSSPNADLRDMPKTILITGATSGFGEAMARPVEKFYLAWPRWLAASEGL